MFSFKIRVYYIAVFQLECLLNNVYKNGLQKYFREENIKNSDIKPIIRLAGNGGISC